MATGRMQKHRYSTEFKITAIKPVGPPGTLIQALSAISLGNERFAFLALCSTCRWKCATKVHER
jgi:hypothetical protein